MTRPMQYIEYYGGLSVPALVLWGTHVATNRTVAPRSKPAKDKEKGSTPRSSMESANMITVPR